MVKAPINPAHRYLNNETYRKCFDICDMVQERRKGKKIDVHDYPAAVASCAVSWEKCNQAKTETSGKVTKDSYDTTPHLKERLEYLGAIGTKRDECNNYIGACAEPHAARSILRIEPLPHVSSLVFSYAYRPRTKTVIRYCRNCTDVFSVQNP